MLITFFAGFYLFYLGTLRLYYSLRFTSSTAGYLEYFLSDGLPCKTYFADCKLDYAFFF